MEAIQVSLIPELDESIIWCDVYIVEESIEVTKL